MTSPYKVIRGSDKNLVEFEKAIAEALLAGYDLAGDLVVSHGGGETLMFQTMVQDDDDYDFDEDDDEDDEDEDEEEYDDEGEEYDDEEEYDDDDEDFDFDEDDE